MAFGKTEINDETIIDLSFLADAKAIERELGALMKMDGVYTVRLAKAVPKDDGILMTLKTTDTEEPDCTLYKRLRLVGEGRDGKSAASGLQGLLFALGYSEAEVQAFALQRKNVKEICVMITSEPRNTTSVEVSAKAISGGIQSDVGYFQTASDLAAKKKAGRGLRSTYDRAALEKDAAAQRAMKGKKAEAKSNGGAVPGLPGQRGVSSPPEVSDSVTDNV